MSNYLKNEEAVKSWIELLRIILTWQKMEMYEEIKKDKELSRMIEIIEEYDDILFKE